MRATRDIRSERGFSVPEVLLAAVIAIVALLAVAAMLSKGIFNSSAHQRQAAALAIAQREIEDVRKIVARYGFDALAMTAQPSAPPAGSLPVNPDNPDWFVTGHGTASAAFKVMESYHDTTRGVAPGTPSGGEPLVIGGSTAYPTTGRVEPSGSRTSGGVTAEVRRYVTQRSEPCLTTNACTGDSRRVTVVVLPSLPATPDLQAKKPVYLTTVVNNPVPRDAEQQPGAGLRVGVNIG